MHAVPIYTLLPLTCLLIFPVNAKTPNAEDYEVAKELTKEILNIASCLQSQETSISWFEFEKHIHQLGR